MTRGASADSRSHLPTRLGGGASSAKFSSRFPSVTRTLPAWPVAEQARPLTRSSSASSFICLPSRHRSGGVAMLPYAPSFHQIAPDVLLPQAHLATSNSACASSVVVSAPPLFGTPFVWHRELADFDKAHLATSNSARGSSVVVAAPPLLGTPFVWHRELADFDKEEIAPPMAEDTLNWDEEATEEELRKLGEKNRRQRRSRGLVLRVRSTNLRPRKEEQF